LVLGKEGNKGRLMVSTPTISGFGRKLGRIFIKNA
jgi:hypothetical protein